MNDMEQNDITQDRAVYVRELQRYLRSIQQAVQGYADVTVNGIFDGATQQAVRRFQTSVGLPATGTVDRSTWDAIAAAGQTAQAVDEAPAPIVVYRRGSPPLSVGTGGDAAEMLNIMLRTLAGRFADLPAPGAADRTYTAQTAAAVAALQKRAGLVDNGITDKQTWNAVVALYDRPPQGDG